jgi:hypothetical protein
MLDHTHAILAETNTILVRYQPAQTMWYAVERTIRAVSNFRLAVLEEEYDEWIEIRDLFDWVSCKGSRT